MKEMKRWAVLLLAFLPIGIMAQTLVTDPESGLEYLDAGDGKLYIDVSGAAITSINGTSSNLYFIPDNTLRTNIRNTYNISPYVISGNTNTDKWYKEDLDNITTLNCSWSNTSDYKGIEYFRNLKTLTVSSSSSSYSVKLDLSKNTKLTSLTFSSTRGLEYVDISNTQLTTVTIPANTYNYNNLKTFKAANTQLKTLNFASFSVLETLDVSNMSKLTSLTLPTSKTNFSSLSINGTDITDLDLDLTAYTKLKELIVDDTQLEKIDDGTLSIPSNLDGRQTEGNITRLFDSSGITELTIDVTNETEKSVDVSIYAELQKLTLIGATNITIAPGRTNFEIDVTQSPDLSELDFSEQNSLTSLTVKGVSRLTLGNLTSTTLTVDGTGNPDLVTDFGTQSSLKTLTLTNMNQVDISGCEALQTLTCLGTEWGDLSDGHLGLICNTGATESAPTLPALTKIIANNSGVMKLDLTNAGMNVNCIDLTNSLTKELRVPNHLSLRTYNNSSSLYAGNLCLGYSSITSQYSNGSSWSTNTATNRLEVIDISGCSNISGSVNITNGQGSYNKSPLREFYANGCARISQIQCYNSDLEKIDIRDCSGLNKYFVEQCYLKTVNLDGCNNITSFNAKRCQFEDADFLTMPTGTRTAEGIAKLTSLQLNGGAYATQIYDAETGSSKVIVPAIYTNKIRNFNTQYLGASLLTLMVADNMLETLDIHDGLTGLTSLQCENNMLLTLDLSKVDATKINSNSRWGWNMAGGVMQVGFLNVEVVKGYAEDGSDDWIAMHLPNGGGYEHLLDNTVKLYPSIVDANADTNEIAEEASPFMGTVEDLNDRLGSQSVCPTGHTGEHLFLHSMTEVLSDNNGKVLDHDLYDKVLTYRYNTQFNGGEKSKEGCDPHIEIRAHIWPYILNINPATKSSEGNNTGISDYYSSTIMLDYDAVIPNDVKVYVVTGFQPGYKEANQPEDIYDAQLVLREIGGAGEVLPANTPVIVKSDVAAGLYAFQTAWDFNYKGWEDYRTSVIKEAVARERGVDASTLSPILHGVDEENVIYKADYDPETYPEKWVNLKQGGAYANAIANNLLKGTLEEMPVASKSILTLGRQKNATTIDPETGEKYASNKLGFWKYKGTSLAAHRCYITVEDMREALKNANMSDSKEGGAFYFDGNATGIETVQSAPDSTLKETQKVVYDLQGRRISGQPTPGIYIVNGRKVMVK